MAELLLDRGYEVHGIIRRSSSFNTARIDHLYRDPHERGVRLFMHYGDLAEPVALTKLIYELQPAEVYHLGAQSHVMVSFEVPEYTLDITGVGTLRILDALRESGVETRFCHAASSEMFGSSPPPQSERTPYRPRSPYGIAKLAAYWSTVNFREAYGKFAVNGILFNYESPRRGETFVTRKITRAAARIKAGLQEKLYLGNLDAERDWGYAPDYMEALWMMMQRDEPEDLVIATGESHSVREFLALAFEHAGPGGLGAVCRDRPALFPAHRGRLAARRRDPRTRGDRLGASRYVPGACSDHGGGRHPGSRRPARRASDPLQPRGRAVSGAPRPEFWTERPVVVTGGAGFLGKPTVRMLTELGAQARVIRSGRARPTR